MLRGKAGIPGVLKAPRLCPPGLHAPPNQSVPRGSLFSTILVPSASPRLPTHRATTSGPAGGAHLVPLLLNLLQLGQDGGHAVLVQVAVLLQRAVLQPQVLHLLQVLRAGGWGGTGWNMPGSDHKVGDPAGTQQVQREKPEHSKHVPIQSPQLGLTSPPWPQLPHL